MQEPLAVLVERADERRGEAAGRAEAGAGREVGERGDLDLRRAQPHHPQRLADDRVADVVDGRRVLDVGVDRKSTRLNSSHLGISYAVFCLKKKRKKEVFRSSQLTRGNRYF